MATSPSTPKIDMAEIEVRTKTALALSDNTDSCKALATIARTLSEGNKLKDHPEYMAPALAVIEQIAARGDTDGVRVLYNCARSNSFPDTMVYPSVLRSLGHLCAGSPSAWDLKGISELIEVNRYYYSRQTPTDDGQPNQLCHLAVDIAMASAKGGSPYLRDRADLYFIAKDAPRADNLAATAAGETKAEAERAIAAGNSDMKGISALLCVSVHLLQSSIERGETLHKPLSISQTADTCFNALEGWRVKYTGKDAPLTPDKPRETVLEELRIGYFWFCTLKGLPPQHAAQQNHAKQMAKWLDHGARGEAPKTAWSVGQEIATPSATSVFERLRQIQQGGGGAANANAKQAKHPSSYACS